MTILLVTLSVIVTFTFFGTLITYITRLTWTLERIGGATDSLLDEITSGVQEIEKQTVVVAPQLEELNRRLESIGEGLASIDALQAATYATLQKQKG